MLKPRDVVVVVFEIAVISFVLCELCRALIIIIIRMIRSKNAYKALLGHIDR